MAKNLIQEGDVLRLTVASDVKAGDPVVVGAFHGVALTDYSATDGKADIRLKGVFELSVKGVDGSGNSAVVIGDKIYYVGGDTPKLSKKATGEYFGIAYGAVTSGATANIPVKLV
jgi:predicted RecA/RadA family phage recombinase